MFKVEFFFGDILWPATSLHYCLYWFFQQLMLLIDVLELFVTRALSLAPAARTMSSGQPVHLGSINPGRQAQPSAHF